MAKTDHKDEKGRTEIRPCENDNPPTKQKHNLLIPKAVKSTKGVSVAL